MALRVVLCLCAIFTSMIAGLPNESPSVNLKQGIAANGDWGDYGPKGYMGWQGYRGLRGSMGERGDKGFPGETGPKGDLGINGPPGAKGDKGNQGLSKKGQKGEKGDPGNIYVGSDGQLGIPGAMGEKGDLGRKGGQGEPGFPGPDGLYGIFGVKGHDGDVGDIGPMGPSVTCLKRNTHTMFNVFATNEIKKILSCKNGNLTNTATDENKVSCEFEGKKVCISYASDKVINYKALKAPFWLSSKNVELKDIYGLDIKQLTWLQRSSYISNLTIRYHCLNSNPSDVRLLSWNNMVVDSEPTATSPVHYSIENDGCSTSPKDQWNSTDIVLASNIVPIFPIIDIFITDIENELFRRKSKAFRLEILNLCVG